MAHMLNEYMKILPSGAIPTQPLTRPVSDLGLWNSRLENWVADSHHGHACFGAAYTAGVFCASSGARTARQEGRSAGATTRTPNDVTSDGEILPSPITSCTKLASSIALGSGVLLAIILDTILIRSACVPDTSLGRFESQAASVKMRNSPSDLIGAFISCVVLVWFGC